MVLGENGRVGLGLWGNLDLGIIFMRWEEGGG